MKVRAPSARETKMRPNALFSAAKKIARMASLSCSHKHAVPINQCKTDDAKNRASEEKARDMVRHAMANWSRWMRSC